MDDRLALSVIHADGSMDRWGPDEPDGKDVPGDLTFTTTIPGGFKDMSCSLMRKLGTYSDQILFDSVSVYGPGGDIAWEGYMNHFPRGQTSVQPSAIGWVNHLAHDTSARELYVHRDLAAWIPPDSDQQISLTSLNMIGILGAQKTSSPLVTGDPNSGHGAVQTGVTGYWNGHMHCEAWFDAKGLPIEHVYFGWVRGSNVSEATDNWVWQVTLGDDHVNTHYIHTANLKASGPAYGVFDTDGARDYKYACVFLDWTYGGVGAGGDNFDYYIYWTCLAVVGKHGLTPYGSQDAYNAPGFLVSDIVADAVRRWAPLVNFTMPGSIEVTTYPVKHFAPMDATTATDIVSRINAFELKDWGCYAGGEDGYPSRTFFFREPSPDRLTWRARLSDGAILTNEGIQGDDVVNGVIVNFTTPGGITWTAGPTGSNCGYIDNSLSDGDPTNPVNSHDIPRKYGVLNVGQVLTTADAVQLGALWLNRRSGVQRRGTLSIVGKVKHPSGTYYPAWRVRAGDYVVVEDDPTDTTPRKIVNTSYTHGNRTIQCDLEHEPFRIDAFMERFGVELVGVV